MNYKVGDEIIIIKPSKEELYKWDDNWVKSMDNYIGNKYKIEKIDKYYFQIIGTYYSFPLCMLENPKEINYEIY